jgi:hypothetical protein
MAFGIVLVVCDSEFCWQGRRDTAKVESQESIDTAAAAADVEKKPIPDIFKDRKKPCGSLA